MPDRSYWERLCRVSRKGCPWMQLAEHVLLLAFWFLFCACVHVRLSVRNPRVAGLSAY